MSNRSKARGTARDSRPPGNPAPESFAAGLVHDLNNLLTTMCGWAQLARDDRVDPSRRREALEILERSARRARDIAAGFPGAGRSAAAVRRPLDLEALVGDLLDLHGLDLERGGIEVATDLEPGLACAGDPLGLFQILDNLVRNAADAMPEGGRLRISTGTLDGGRVFAAVEDSGPGVDPSMAAVMFDPFVTSKSRVPGTRESGNGLGLDICRRLAREHGGDVTWSPAAGGGARFALELPRVPAPPTPGAPIGIDAAPRPSIPPGIAVLVVDDEEDICEMIRTALGLRGAHVVTATGGEAALAACRARRFDLALVDFTMCGLAGHDLGRALVGLQPGLPLIFMSGDRIDLSGAAHVSDFLKKPFDVEDIQRKVREVLGRGEGPRARG